MVLLLLAVLLLGVPAASGGRAGGTAVAFVSAEDDDALVAVDLTTARVVARIALADGPHNVAVAGGLRWVLVTSPPAGVVTMVDAFTLRVVRVFRGFRSPHDVEVEGGYAYVTDEGWGELAVIDLTGRRVVARARVGARPHDVAVGDVALVTHGPRAPYLTVVDVRDPRRPLVAGRIDAGGPAHDISEQPDSAWAYVTYWGSGLVAAVDWGRRRVLWRRRVGSLVHHVQADVFRGRRVWATDHEGGRAYLLSSRDGRILRSLDGCPGAHHLALAGTAWVAVACHDAGALAIYSTRTWRRRLVAVGAGPHGVAVAVVP